MIAKVVINSNVKTLNKTFDYSIPDKLKDKIFVGVKVLVPFGRMKNGVEGYVIGIEQTSKFETKDILDVLEEVNEFYIKLAKWMSIKYFCNYSECIKLMLSPGTKDRFYDQKVKDKFVNKVFVNSQKVPKEKLQESLEILRGDKQKALISFLLDNYDMVSSNGIEVVEIENKLSISRQTINSIFDKNLIEICEEKTNRNPLLEKDVEKDYPKVLNDEQQKVYDEISQSIDDERFCKYLIYGVTGSGKTEIYLQLISKVLEKGKRVIMLVPEISLTPQIINRFIARFGKENLAVFHSKLSNGERLDEWNRMKNGEAQILIGARSALFTPVDNLGLVIVDEQHDASYKSETNPKYETCEVAQKICTQFNIPLVLGSATPDVAMFYNIAHKEKQNSKILYLKTRANMAQLPQVNLIDMRTEKKIAENKDLSERLINEIEKNLKKKEQTILFLNRRGYNTYLTCPECGYVFKCPHCDINLTYHKKDNSLKCHYCSYDVKTISHCPSCNCETILYKGIGTQKLEQDILNIFPQAQILRMDNDTTNVKNGHEKILKKFNEENYDILIGTQMVVKGHHFPNVTLVGIVNADSLLYMDDYKASEKTFQILTQVSGRAGREEKQGRVFIQTSNPDNFSIVASSKNDFDTFYNIEIRYRELLNFPPFCNIMVVNITGEKLNQVEKCANDVYSFLKKQLQGFEIEIFKPQVPKIEFLQNRYRYMITLKGNIRQKENAVLNKCLKVIHTTLKNNELRISFDLDPNNLS